MAINFNFDLFSILVEGYLQFQFIDNISCFLVFKASVNSLEPVAVVLSCG